MGKDNINSKSNMKIQAEKVNKELSVLIEQEKVLQTSIGLSIYKIEHEKKIAELCKDILKGYLEPIVKYEKNKVVIATNITRFITIEDFIDFSEYNSIYMENWEKYWNIDGSEVFDSWLSEFFKEVSFELSKKMQPILKEIIEVLNSYTEYKFFIVLDEVHKIQNSSLRPEKGISALYKLVVDIE